MKKAVDILRDENSILNAYKIDLENKKKKILSDLNHYNKQKQNNKDAKIDEKAKDLILERIHKPDITPIRIQEELFLNGENNSIPLASKDRVVTSFKRYELPKKEPEVIETEEIAEEPTSIPLASKDRVVTTFTRYEHPEKEIIEETIIEETLNDDAQEPNSIPLADKERVVTTFTRYEHQKNETTALIPTKPLELCEEVKAEEETKAEEEPTEPVSIPLAYKDRVITNFKRYSPIIDDVEEPSSHDPYATPVIIENEVEKPEVAIGPYVAQAEEVAPTKNVPIVQKSETPKEPEKKGFFSSLFGKKKKEEPTIIPPLAVAPVVEEKTPEVKTAPVVEEKAAEVEEITPVVEEKAAEVEEITPVVEEKAPEIKTAPVVEEKAPEVKSTPVVEEPVTPTPEPEPLPTQTPELVLPPIPEIPQYDEYELLAKTPIIIDPENERLPKYPVTYAELKGKSEEVATQAPIVPIKTKQEVKQEQKVAEEVKREEMRKQAALDGDITPNPGYVPLHNPSNPDKD